MWTTDGDKSRNNLLFVTTILFLHYKGGSFKISIWD